MDIQRILAQNVRRHRLAADLSQWQLVERLEALDADLGVDQAYLSHLENGRKNPTLITVACIAKALGVTVAQLVQEPDAG
ncbi:helix-turn-helix domain-containing protein [Microvirga sp. ACRRW]|uniref:helix-turn-helix domain-containing protein n=1 Tax=Microvirga sp. ACRRW TaxID=2918205 RepID=UPI001EF505C5|nr:helix-turn-helix transcriptional regulator [Microvirga sp. ACRRW]MCG7392897.1 helix-turn-helix domain-containing protein [Microvirga sp. ACRRW]